MKKLNHNTYQFPSWQKIAKTYSGAIQIRLDELKASRLFYNYLEGQIDEAHIRETKEKVKGMKKVTKNGVVTIEVQLGQKWKGKSVADLRKLYTEGEIGLGAYEVLTILLISPEILQKYEDLLLDCPGDEFDYAVSHVRFGHAACLRFRGGLEFGTGGVSRAGESFGSVSGFVPQANLESGNLEPSESLDTLSAIKLLKDNGFIITKVY